MEIMVNAVYKTAMSWLVGKIIDREGKNRVFVKNDQTRISCEIHYGRLSKGFSEVILPPIEQVGRRPDYFILVIGLLEAKDGVSRIFAENGEEKKPFYTDPQRGIKKFACGTGSWTVVTNKEGRIRKEELTLAVQKQTDGVAVGLFRKILQDSAPTPKKKIEKTEKDSGSLTQPLLSEEIAEKLVVAAMGLKNNPFTKPKKEKKEKKPKA